MCCLTSHENLTVQFLVARSVINMGDYSEVSANVWWMWCSVPIKICCHAAQTTRIHNHCVTSGEIILWRSRAASVHCLGSKSDLERWYLDTGTMRSKYSPKTILIYESLGHCSWCWQSVPHTGVMAQSRHQADGPRGPGQVTRSWCWSNREIKIKYEMPL